MVLSHVKNSLECCILASFTEVKKYRKKLINNFELQHKLTNLEYLYGLYDFVTEDLQKQYSDKIKSLCDCCLDLFSNETILELIPSPVQQISEKWIVECFDCEKYPTKWVIETTECESTTKWIIDTVECEKYPYTWVIEESCCQVIPCYNCN